MFVNYSDKNFTQAQFSFGGGRNALAMCKADWRGEAAYRLAGLISNLWQQYVSPRSNPACPCSTQTVVTLYMEISVFGAKKIKKVRLAL